MADHQQQLLPALTGMATATEISELPLNRAQRMTGMFPGRHGRNRVMPQPKVITENFAGLGKAGIPNSGGLVWKDIHGAVSPILLVLCDGTLFAVPGLTVINQVNNTGNPQVTVDPAMFLNANPVSVKVLFGDGPMSGFQYQSELLIFDSSGNNWRFYYDQGTNEYRIFPLGLDAPNQSILTPFATSGALIAGDYAYVTTWVDEQGRESSPSPVATTTTTGIQNHIIVGQGSGTQDASVEFWNIYRRNPGGTEFFYLTQVPIGTTSYDDSVTPDADILSNPIAPDPGENDAPEAATFGAVWNNRIVLNSISNPTELQVSNAGSATQFASFSEPSTNLAAGMRFIVGDDGGAVSGLCPFGPYCIVMSRTTTYNLQGEDNNTFYISQLFKRGCTNPDSVQRATVPAGGMVQGQSIPGRNIVLFVSDDGPYTLSYQYVFHMEPIGLEVANLFRNFPLQQHPPTGDPNNFVPVMQGAPLRGKVCSWMQDNIYFLSGPWGTLAYDLIAEGWTDTNWGTVKWAATTAIGYAWEPTLGELIGTVPVITFLSRGNYSFTHGAPISFDQSQGYTVDLSYFKLDDNATDTDAPRTAFGQIVTRAYDGEQIDPRGRSKKARRYRVWGTTRAPKGTQIGTLTVHTDRGVNKTFPIRVGLLQYDPGVLYEQEMPLQAIGRAIWFTETYIRLDIERASAMMQYDPIGR